MNGLRTFVVALLLFARGVARVDAAERSPQALIVQRLQAWADAFNRGDTSRVCDVFSPSLVATVPDAPSQNRSQVCANLERVLARDDRRLHYSSTIHEVIVSGDYAVVRLDWTLRVTQSGKVSTTLEHGMDVFQKDRRGTWSIVRFLAFSDAATRPRRE